MYKRQLETAERVTGQRELGTDPKSGRPIYARMGKYGPMIQIGDVSDEEKPLFAKMRQHQHIATISLEEALDLFQLPKKIGEYRDDEVIVAVGRFGPYVRNTGKFYSIPKGEDPLEVTLERAKEIIEAKEEADRNKLISDFSDHGIQVLNGRWGPYIKAGKKNVRIPKGTEAKTLTLEECQELVAKAPEKKGRGGGRAKKK